MPDSRRFGNSLGIIRQYRKAQIIGGKGCQYSQSSLGTDSADADKHLKELLILSRQKTIELQAVLLHLEVGI